MVGHVPQSQVYLPRPLFLCCSPSCSHFSQQLAWGTPGVASSCCGQISFLPWASPRQWSSGVWAHTPGVCMQTTAAERMRTQASQQAFAVRRDELLECSQKHGQV